MTEWRPLPGNEGRYEISDDGQVRSLVTNNRGGVGPWPMTVRTRAHGYKYVILWSPALRRSVSVGIHRLVLEAFVRPPRPGEVCRHMDDNPANNNVGNLRWGTISDNSFDAVAHGTHNMTRKTHCKRGHEFTPENTTVRDGKRVCRTCNRERQHNRYLASKLDAAADGGK